MGGAEQPGGTSIKGIALGALVDVVATIVATIVITSLMGATRGGAFGASAEEVASDAMPYLMLAGAACSVLGGWVAGRVAGAAETRNALLLGVALTLLGLVTMRANMDALGAERAESTTTFTLVGVAATLPCCWLGGLLASRQRAAAQT